MNKNTIIAIILGVLVLVSVVQAFQLNTMKDKIKEGKISLGNAKTTNSGGNSGNLPANIQDLPSMVGGC